MDEIPLRRLKAVGFASFTVLLVAAVTVAFTNASGARSIALDSGVLHWSNVTSGVAAVARGSLHQAAIFSIDEELGVSGSDETEQAIAEAGTTLSALEDLTRRVPSDLYPIGVAVAQLAVDGRQVLDSLSAANNDGAARMLDERFEPHYATIAASLGSAQATYAGRIDAAESVAAHIETAMRWLATLLIPGLAVVLYRAFVRRRYRRTEIEFGARLRAEQRISRAKDEFIAAISHELRTPLTTIVGFSDHLLESGLDVFPVRVVDR